MKCKYCKNDLPKNRKSFCNRKCQCKYDTKPRIALKCQICDLEFFVTEKYIKKQNPKYCSNKCRGIGRHNNSIEIRICPICKDEFEIYKKTKKIYCGNKCAARALGKLRVEKSKETLKKKYNVDHPSQLESTKQKIRQKRKDGYFDNMIINMKQTKKEKYGNEYYTNIKKMRQTKKDKYGDENYNNREKAKQTYFNKIYKRLQDIVIPMFSIEEYDGVVDKKYKFQCKKCNTIFEDTINNGKIPRCLKCYPTNRPISSLEKEILNYIKMIYNGIIIENSRKLLNRQEIDIYIPDKNFAIEFNGKFWHSEVGGGKDKNYHLQKTKLCEDQGIQLIHIFEDEWLYKQDIVKSRLQHILGQNNGSVFARNCQIREITSTEKQYFLDQYHIQGNDKSTIKLGLFNNKDLVAVMTFGKRKLGFEFLRFATSKSVTGGAGKLLKYFIRNYNPTKIISYADRRWTYKENNLYEKIGFEKIGETLPNYWYMKKHSNRTHRFNFRKQVLNEKLKSFDENLTEWQNMQLNGYDRIWDCGSWKYEMLIN